MKKIENYEANRRRIMEKVNLRIAKTVEAVEREEGELGVDILVRLGGIASGLRNLLALATAMSIYASRYNRSELGSWEEIAQTPEVQAILDRFVMKLQDTLKEGVDEEIEIWAVSHDLEEDNGNAGHA